jgi:3-phenylpropionate/trans-cinnamate dioxygenase ferredoxin component
MAFVRVAALSELPAGTVMGVEAGGRRICLANCDGEILAFSDNCSHRDFPLSNGELDADDCTITCEWHGASFDMRTGHPLCLPAIKPIEVYDCRIEEGAILVDAG